ncbi:MAG: hypothetical protein L6R38_001566 [Xanthoria sp. 2 TBL-2021]|nr:MAG: hypothetical protein L6R38_001566 [Xanthoria sp. 2 TBL-2021]
MCIHHLKLHAPCGHTKQLTEELVYCKPVARAIAFYNKQPEAAQHHMGRFAYDPMKAPQPCGGNQIGFLRNVPPTSIVGQNRNFVPEGWQPKMTYFVKMLLDKREDYQSIIILTETEFPQMVGKISERWIRHMHECFENPDVNWSPPQDLQNSHVGGNIITEIVQRGCGRGQTGNPSCFEGWKNPFGGIAVCPYIWSQENGQPMPRRPDHEVADLLSGNKGPAPFIEWFHRELQLQAQDRLQLYGMDVDSLETGLASTSMGTQSAPSLAGTSHSPQSLPSLRTENHGLVTRTRGSTSNYRWPPASAPGQSQGHSKSASV